MAINMMYLLTILVGVYFGITVYIQTKQKLILWALAILIISIVLEAQRMNLWNYSIDTTDIFRTLRDIWRTILTILWFKLHIKNHKKIHK